MQIIKAYDQTYCIQKTPNFQICCVLFKHVYYVIDVTKKLQVSPVNKRYLAIDIHALIPLNQKNQPCISLLQSVTSKQSKMYITLCILRYRPESAHFGKPSIDVQTFFSPCCHLQLEYPLWFGDQNSVRIPHISLFYTSYIVVVNKLYITLSCLYCSSLRLPA